MEPQGPAAFPNVAGLFVSAPLPPPNISSSDAWQKRMFDVHLPVQSSAPPQKANFQGANLGIFNIADILIITQSQVDTFKNISNGDNVTAAELNYRVYPTAGAPGSFTTQIYNFQSNAPFTDIGNQSITGNGDQSWGNTTDINLNPGVAGDYTVEVFFKANTNLGDRFSNNAGNNFLRRTLPSSPSPPVPYSDCSAPCSCSAAGNKTLAPSPY